MLEFICPKVSNTRFREGASKLTGKVGVEGGWQDVRDRLVGLDSFIPFNRAPQPVTSFARLPVQQRQIIMK